ncbi:MAG: exosortase U, partial [Planctomycetota bacterium]
TDSSRANQNQTPSRREPLPSTRSDSSNLTAIIGAVLLVAAHLPLLMDYVARMWEKDHYGFMLVLVPGCIAMLGLGKWHFRSERNASANAFGLGFLVLGMAVSFMASMRFSPWMGVIGLLISMLGWLSWSGGWLRFRLLLPVWVMSLFFISLPQNRDEDLITGLQRISANVASGALDYLGVLHLRSGTVIDLPNKRLFVTEACSGVNSFFVLLVTSAFISLFGRRGWIRGIALMLLTPFVILLENTTRLVVIVIAAKYDIDLASGTPHEVLGYIVVVLAALTLLSLDYFILFLLPSRFRTDAERDEQHRDMLRRKRVISPNYAFYMLGPAVLALPMIGIQYWQRPDLSKFQIVEPGPITVAMLPVETLPETVGSLKRVQHVHVERDVDDPLGANSQVWIYEHDAWQLQVSVDYSYPHLHNTCLCYLQTGWNLESQMVYQPIADANEEELSQFARSEYVPTTLMEKQPGSYALDQAPYGLAKINRPLDGEGMVFFSYFTPTGRLGARLQRSALETEREMRDPPTTVESQRGRESMYQVQMVVRGPDAHASKHLGTFTKLYQQMRVLLVTAIQRGDLATPVDGGPANPFPSAADLDLQGSTVPGLPIDRRPVDGDRGQIQLAILEGQRK